MSHPVLIVEFDGRGHRLYYVRLLAETALRDGSDVTLLLGDADHVEDFVKIHLANVVDRVRIERSATRDWQTIEQTATAVGAGVTVIPESDSMLLGLVQRGGWRGPGSLSLLVMRPQVPPIGSRLRRVIANLVKTLVLGLLLVMPRVHPRVLRGALWQGRSIWPPAQDPIGLTCTTDDVKHLRSEWNISPDRYWFGVLGAVTANKNVPTVAESLALLADRESVGLLVAGSVEPSVAADLETVEAKLRERGVEVRIVDRVLTDVELDSALSAVDCLVLAYHHLGSSGTFGKAVAAGTRIVGAGSPTLKDDCRAAGPGASWSELTVAGLSISLATAVTSPRPQPRRLGDEATFTSALLLRSRG